MTARRARIDADELHEQRLEQARQDLQSWGQWVMQRTDGGLGFGQGCLANLQRVSRSADDYRAPIAETHCSQIDDAVRSLHPDARTQVRLHFGGGFSFAFIARQHRCAPATVSRNIALAVRTVAYWGRTQPCERSGLSM
jgi:DNA-directed RNA polymerase specialized sigma24 family protein